MGFKLGSGRKSIYDNNKGFTLKRTELEGNVMGLATKNNVIHVNSKIMPGSKLYKETIAHEYDHMKRLNRGELSYCLLYTSPSPRDRTRSRMPSSA